MSARGRLMGALPEGGAMLAIEATEDEVRRAHAERRRLDRPPSTGRAPSSLSGDRGRDRPDRNGSVGRARKTTRLPRQPRLPLTPHGPDARRLPRRSPESLTYSTPRIPVISNVSGDPRWTRTSQRPTTGSRHVREAVRFADGITTLEPQAGVTKFLELGPDAVP